MKPQFTQATNEEINAKDLAARLPAILKSRNTQEAFDTISNYRAGDDWLPEAMMLLNAGKFSRPQREHVTKTLVPNVPLHKLDGSTRFPDHICQLFGMVGRIGFSFPEWRFLAQGFGNQGSLMERYGMERLKRPSDVLDPSLPPGHPDRDYYGTGFALEKDNLYIEYRRAYILCSDLKKEMTIVIRNNSFFFGRDRLPEPAYISDSKHTLEELQNFDETSFAKGKSFMPLQYDFDHFSGNTYALGTRSRKIIDLIEDFDWQNELMANWIFGKEGKPHLKEFMDHMLTRQKAAGKATPPFYICRYDKESAPWVIQASVPASRNTLDGLDEFKFTTSWCRFGLLSSASGDFPVKPVAQADLAGITPAGP